MADQVGYPFNQYPAQIFTNYGAGFTQASLCGSIGCAAACIGAVCDADTAKAVLGELETWYRGAELPIYQPENLNLPTTVADSILCADSVGKFMEKSGYAMADPERKARCAGVAADVTKKMVELLNAKFA